MVRRRRPNQNKPRGRRQIRTQLRQIHRALTNEPRRSLVPPDPPNVQQSFVHSNIVPIILLYDKSVNGSKFNTGDATGTESSITFGLKDKERFVPADLKYSDLWSAWCAYTGHNTTGWFHADICVIKVHYWGPSHTDLTSSPIGLTVELPAPGSSAAITDSGTTTVRARCGFALPCFWQGVESTSTLVRLDCDAEGTLKKSIGTLEKLPQLGYLHITTNVRITRTI